VWIKRLEIELDNLRSALEYSRELEDECEAGMFMAGSLAQFWYMRGYWSEGRDWLEEMRRRGHSRATAGRAKMLLGIGILAWDQDDYRAARPCLEQSRDIYHQLDDSEGYAVSSLVLGSVLGTMGEYTTAEELLKDAQEYHMRAGVPRDTVFCLVYRARIAFEQEDYATARSLSEECLAISRPLEHRWGSAFALMLLGSIAGKEGQFDRAIALCQESTALSEILGNKRGAARSRLVIGLIACRQELFAEANTHFQSCLRIFRELGDKEGLCYTFEGMALLAALSDRFEYAVRLLSTAQTLRDSLGIPLPPSSRTMKEKWLTRARAQLDAELFARAWAEGAAVEYGVTLPARLPEASKG
jgi:tetratricopeptide (TPR) repeat protein